MTKHSRAYGLVTKGLRGGSLALAGQCLLWIAACSSGDVAPIEGPLDEDTDEATTEEGTTDDEDTDDEADPPVTPPKVDAGTRDAGGTKPLDAAVTPPKADAGGASTDKPDAEPDEEPTEPTEPEPSTSGSSSCLDGITDYGPKGKFEYQAKTSGSIKFWVPMVPAGCKVPIVHLANGTGATCSNYGDALKTLASHGFLTACYENTNTGAGTQGLMAFEKALSEFPDLADRKFGSTGHSQGGQASFIVLQLAEAKFGADAVYAGLAMQPASGFGTQPSGGSWQSIYAKIKSPMFMFSGTADTLVSEGWVKRGFDALDDSIEAYNWSASGATHIPTPQKEEQEVSIPWFRWKLLGDKKACQAFKGLLMGSRWKERQVQNAKSCE